MSIYVTRNTDGVLIKAPCLKAVGSGGNLGLPPTFPLSATWACYPDSLAADCYDIFTYGYDPFDAAHYYMAATWSAYLGQAELLAESKSPYPVLLKYYSSLWACLPMKTVNDYSCEFIRSRNRRQWTVPSAVAGVVKTGNFRAPLQRRQRIWYYG